MRGKIIAGVLAVAAAVLTALGLGYTFGSDRRSDELALVERQLTAEREEVEQLLAHCETLEPSRIEPVADSPGGGGAEGGQAGAIRSWTGRLTRGFPQAVAGTEYRVTVEDVRPAPGGGHAVTVAVADPRRREAAEIATGETATVNGVEVKVTGADVAGARLALALP